MHACAEPCGVSRFAVRENDGADYVISMGGRVNHSLLDLIPAFCNVRLRFVDNSTMHSDTCSFQKALVEFGKPHLMQACHFAYMNVVHCRHCQYHRRSCCQFCYYCQQTYQQSCSSLLSSKLLKCALSVIRCANCFCCGVMAGRNC